MAKFFQIHKPASPWAKGGILAVMAAVIFLAPRAVNQLEADDCGTGIGHCTLGNSSSNSTGYNYNSYPTPTPSYNNNYPYTGSGSTVTGTFTLISNNEYCLGQSPTYAIEAPSSWAGQIINWTSSYNGQLMAQNTYQLGSNGTWSGTGNQWDNGMMGSWQKTASINGATQTITFTVTTCGNSGTGYNNTGYGGYPTPTPPVYTNGYYPPGSYVAPNGYICSPPNQQNGYY